MVGFEKVLGAVKVIKDQIQYMSQRLLNLASIFLYYFYIYIQYIFFNLNPVWDSYRNQPLLF